MGMPNAKNRRESKWQERDESYEDKHNDAFAIQQENRSTFSTETFAKLHFHFEKTKKWQLFRLKFS